MARILITGIQTLAGTSQDSTGQVVSGSAMNTLNSIENAYLAIEDDKIVDFGPMTDLQGIADWNNLEVIDAEGQTVLPGWVDPHTHVVYAKSRESEFVDRINGLTYEEIGKKGGGIVNSALRLRDMSEDDLYNGAFARLNEIMASGTVAVEIKSGYGLSVESEFKMLRVIKRLKENHPITIKATLLAAHAIPPEYKENREGYIQAIFNDILPVVAKEKLADYIDVFCERNYYTAEETDRILAEGAKYGLRPKVHVNQFSIAGGVEAALKHNALSVDHLEEMNADQIERIAESEAIPTVLPGCSFFLSIPYAPAREMIDAGLPVALATDFNPGSTPSGNIPFLLSLACLKMKLTPEEAVNASTINAAAAIELSETHGSITVGKQASLIFTESIPSLAYMPYAYGSNHIKRVMVDGKFVK